MKIVNPLYDNAFKYLMDNEQIAKKVLSIILNQPVLSLQSKPQEISIDPDHYRGMARYDFKAVIRNAQNEEQSVLIELQKYKTPNPILRFREYLAENYKKEETIINAQGEEIKQALPIITIYILGYNITKTEALALKVDRTLKDIIWDEPIHESPDFVELLTHSSFILQVDAKPKKLKNTQLERFISLFSQKLKNEQTNYVIDIELDAETQADKEITAIVNHLNSAILDEAVVRSLKYEQSLADGIVNLERANAELSLQIEQERKEKETAKQEKERERQQREAAEIKISNLVKKLHNKGFSKQEIAEDTGLSEDEITKILSEKHKD